MTDKIITLNKPADAAYIIWRNFPPDSTPRQLTEGQDYEFLSNYVIRFIGPFLEAGVFDSEDNIINVSTLQYNYDAQNPAVLIDRKDGIVITEVPIWNPARQQYDPKAIYAVDFRKPADPARYNNKIQTNTDPDVNFWDSRFVNKVWFDVSKEYYFPYDDKNLEPNLETRLRNWGKLAEFGEINVYQWTESNVPPAQYDVLAEEEETDDSIPLEQRKTGRSRKVLYRNDGTFDDPIWVIEEDQIFEIISDLVTNISYPETFSDLDNNPRPGSVEVYINGVLNEDYTFFDQTSFKVFVESVGSKKIIHVIRRATNPTQEQLENREYKFDTPYSIVEKINSTTGNPENFYYFWVEDKLTKIKIKGGPTSSITFSAVKDALQNISTPYLIPLNPIDLAATGFADIFITNSPRTEDSESFEFPFAMNQLVVRGLNEIVSPDDRYVLRFTRDFTLRDKLKSYILPTPTPSVTPTLTPTPSVTSSITPTPTVGVTTTPTITPSRTPTQTPTTTVGFTGTVTPTPSVTSTPTLTPTPTVTTYLTPTVTPTMSVTPSPTFTPTPTITASITPTPTSTPRIESGISDLQKKNVHWEWKLIREKQFTKIDRNLWNEIIEALVGFEYTGGPIEGPEVSLTPTPTVTPTPSPSPVGVTVTPTITPSRTPTLTPPATATPTVTPSRTGTPIAPTPSSTVTPTRTPAVTPTPSPGPVGALSNPGTISETSTTPFGSLGGTATILFRILNNGLIIVTETFTFFGPNSPSPITTEYNWWLPTANVTAFQPGTLYDVEVNIVGSSGDSTPPSSWLSGASAPLGTRLDIDGSTALVWSQSSFRNRGTAGVYTTRTINFQVIIREKSDPNSTQRLTFNMNLATEVQP
jgi:hypothetical protein